MSKRSTDCVPNAYILRQVADPSNPNSMSGGELPLTWEKRSHFLPVNPKWSRTMVVINHSKHHG